MAEITRENFLTYIEIDGGDYALLGDGIESATLSMNAQTKETQYIHEATGRTITTAYRPTFPFSSNLVASDDALAYLDEGRRQRRVGPDAETNIVNVWKYIKPSGESGFEAERQRVSIEFGDFGGDGGESLGFGFTLNYLGDPDIGNFDVASKKFTKTSTLTGTSGMSGATIQATPTSEYIDNKENVSETKSGNKR